MNYIWDTIIKAKRLGIEKERLKFQLAKEYSPYMEMAFFALNEIFANEAEDGEILIEVNPYGRRAGRSHHLVQPPHRRHHQHRFGGKRRRDCRQHHPER